jgi:hypothetical protein
MSDPTIPKISDAARNLARWTAHPFVPVLIVRDPSREIVK